MDNSFNKKGLIEHTVEVNIYYQGYREKMKINIISGQKWIIILKMPQPTCHNSEIDQKIEEIKMMRCSKKCREQWRLKCGKLEWQKQKKEEKREKMMKIEKMVEE